MDKVWKNVHCSSETTTGQEYPLGRATLKRVLSGCHPPISPCQSIAGHIRSPNGLLSPFLLPWRPSAVRANGAPPPPAVTVSTSDATADDGEGSGGSPGGGGIFLQLKLTLEDAAGARRPVYLGVAPSRGPGYTSALPPFVSIVSCSQPLPAFFESCSFFIPPRSKLKSSENFCIDGIVYSSQTHTLTRKSSTDISNRLIWVNLWSSSKRIFAFEPHFGTSILFCSPVPSMPPLGPPPCERPPPP